MNYNLVGTSTDRHNPDDAYISNRKFNTPVITGILAAGLSKLLSDTSTVRLPVWGNVNASLGFGIYAAASSFIGDYMEWYASLWAELTGYERLGYEIIPPVYSGLAATGLHMLGGNNLGIDPFLITTPSHHLAKYIANTYINRSTFYERIHKNGLIPTIEKGDVA